MEGAECLKEVAKSEVPPRARILHPVDSVFLFSQSFPPHFSSL